jgi:uncharacterized protein (TIGR03437 family)
LKTFVVTLGLLGTVLAATSAAQTPVIGGLENNYSFVVPGLPNYGIAQGSIFDIFGSNLASASTSLQATPVTPLSGVSVSVTVAGTTTKPLLYYVTPGQIAAVLPSSTPAGTGTISVTNNGQTSATASIVVVKAAFGLLTLNGAGSGPAAAFDSHNAYLGASNAANPNDTIVLWGTGAGPVANDLQQAATNNLTVYIGGVTATVVYQGRSSYAGLDQINVVIPAGVSGCYVSVMVVSGTFVSNASSVPVAASGRTCSDTAVGAGILTSTQLQNLAGKSTYSIGAVGMFKSVSSTPAQTIGGITIPGSNIDIEDGFAAFEKITLPANYDSYVSNATVSTVSIGSCTVYADLQDTSSTPPAAPTVTISYLNAGPAVNVSGPVGTKAMPLTNTQGILSYNAQLGGTTGTSTLPTFIPNTGGTFTFDNGSGGPDVGAFKASLSLNPVVWTNSTITTVNRAAGQNITWTGGDANTYVTIGGASFISSGTKFLYGSFTCIAPSTAHQFTIPPPVLLAMPASGSITSGGFSIPEPGSLTVSSFGNSTTFSAPGIDLGYIYAYSGSGASVTYQ